MRRLSRAALATVVLVPMWSMVVMRPLATSMQNSQPGGSQPASRTVVPVKLPLGVSPTLYELAVSAGGEPRPERVRLGEKFFKDKRLSADNTVACANCHEPEKGFVDGKRVSDGIAGRQTQRNSPTVLNAMFNATQFWDGRAATLEDQAKLPILTNAIEMGMKSPEQVVQKLKGIPEYVQQFQTVFGRDVTYDDLAAAIAAFERTQFSGDAPFDRFMLGERTAISASAQRGWACSTARSLQHLPRGGRREPAVHGSEVSQHRHRRAQERLSAAGPRGAEGGAHRRPEADRRAGDRDQVQRARPLPGDQERERHRRLQDPEPAQHRHHRPVHARRVADDAVGRHGPLQPSRAGSPIRSWTGACSGWG